MPWRPTLPTRTAWHLVPDLPANHPHRPRQASSAALPAGVLPPGTRRRTWNSPLCQPVDPLHTEIGQRKGFPSSRHCEGNQKTDLTTTTTPIRCPLSICLSQYVTISRISRAGACLRCTSPLTPPLSISLTFELRYPFFWSITTPRHSIWWRSH